MARFHRPAVLRPPEAYALGWLIAAHRQPDQAFMTWVQHDIVSPQLFMVPVTREPGKERRRGTARSQ